MAETYTSNLGLVKPDYDSFADIFVINSNMDKIDNAVANAGKVKSVNGKTGEVNLTASDVGALPSGGTAADSNKLGGKAPEYYIQPRNLLDNSDFEIAQAGYGEMHGTTKFAADRWECHAGLVVSKVSNGLEISSTREYDGMWQYLGIDVEKYSGKRMTAAMSVNGDVFAVTSTMGANQVNVVGNGATLILALAGTSPYVQVNVTRVATVINWVALYEGEYTVETLPPYVPKGYAAESAECQRYFFQIDTYSPIGNGHSVGSEDARIAIVTPVEMRNTPSLNDSFDLTIVGNGVSKTVTSITVGSKSGNIVRLNIVSSGLTAGYVYSAFTGGTGALQLSADL